MGTVRRSLTLLSSFVLVVGMLISLATSANAYGPANWQATFSGNFDNQSGAGGIGFWGWCAFSGGAGSGKPADCSFSNYFFGTGGANTGFLFSARINGTLWDMEPTSFTPLPPGFPPDDFFITAGTETLSGPAIVRGIAAGLVPPGCTVTGSTLTCPIPVLEKAGLYMPDTGIPAAADHYSLKNALASVGQTLPPGNHLNIQVVQIP